MSEEPHDDLEQRCRLLGHPVPFSYCRQLPEGRPCRLIADCWHDRFDVMAYLQSRYTPEEIASFLARPQPKLTSIVELIEKARKANESSDA